MRDYWAKLLGRARFGTDGLMPAIVQDVETGDVLMVAYMDDEALRLSAETGEAWFWSRSREKLWHKGEVSGNRMAIERMALDCDGDTLLLQVRPMGPACHTGARSCFICEEPEAEAERIARYNGKGALRELDEQVNDRKRHPVEGSYTNELLKAGIDRVLRKVGEEAGEFIIAAMNAKAGGEQAKRLAAEELADLLYHSIVALSGLGMSFSAVEEVLVNRRGAPRRVRGGQT